MPKPTLDEVLKAADPMLSDNFELLIPNVPGASGQDARAMRIQCKTAVKPGSTINEVLVELFGHATNHAGARTYSHDFQVTYIEVADGRIGRALEAWANECRNHDTQTGSFKEDYATDAEFIIYNQPGEKIATHEIVGLWPKQVPDLNFDGAQGTQAVELSVSFSFDYVHEV